MSRGEVSRDIGGSPLSLRSDFSSHLDRSVTDHLHHFHLSCEALSRVGTALRKRLPPSDPYSSPNSCWGPPPPVLERLWELQSLRALQRPYGPTNDIPSYPRVSCSWGGLEDDNFLPDVDHCLRLEERHRVADHTIGALTQALGVPSGPPRVVPISRGMGC